MSTEVPYPTLLDNLAQLLHVNPWQVIYDGPADYSAASREKYGLTNITSTASLAKRYTLLLGESDTTRLYFIIIDDTAQKQAMFMGVEYLLHFMTGLSTTEKRPQVYITTTFPSSNIEQVMQGLDKKIMPYSYRGIAIPNLMLLAGSPQIAPRCLSGHVMWYELIEQPGKITAFNGKRYSVIYRDDPACALVNAIPGDLIKSLRVISESHSAEIDVDIREVRERN